MIWVPPHQGAHRPRVQHIPMLCLKLGTTQNAEPGVFPAAGCEEVNHRDAPIAHNHTDPLSGAC